MTPDITDYGSEAELHLILSGIKGDHSIEISEDDGQFWFSLRNSRGKSFGTVSIDLRSNRNNTYDKYHPNRDRFPRPATDTEIQTLSMEVGEDQLDELSRTVHVGQYLNRVAGLDLEQLVAGTPPEVFPTVDDADSFMGMYVVSIEQPAVVADEVPEVDSDSVAELEGVETHADDDGEESPAEGVRDPDSKVEEDSEETEDETPPSTVTIFDAQTEQAFTVEVSTLIAHYGVTIWNTNEYWD